MNLLNRKYWSYQFAKKAKNALKTGGLMLLLAACQPPASIPYDFSGIEKLLASGEFKRMAFVADSLKSAGVLKEADLRKLDSLVDLSQRIRVDFRRSEDEIKKQLAKYFPELDSARLAQWETTQNLENRLIDGEKRYFKNAVANLFRLDAAARMQKDKIDGIQVDSLDIFRLKNTAEIIAATTTFGAVVLPVKMKLSYMIDVDINAVPDGKVIRCWMPFPREGHARQSKVRLISSEPSNARIAANSNLQRSVYLEQKAVKDQPATFRIELEIETAAQYFDLKPEDVKPYQTESLLFREFTLERPPHIVFSPQMKNLSNRIVAGETNPLKKVQKIYNWINDTIPWATALEYSIMPNIPEYVLKYGHGDCGMQTLLFMTLVRAQGIPAKWQSGWMLHPGEVNLHDWCEVYFEGVGWVPVDQSFGLQESSDEKVRAFYRSGIDAYRLIVNDDFSRELTPKKKFPRSEPIDSQRGELEWEGGNLYFDQWNWDMKVEYQ